MPIQVLVVEDNPMNLDLMSYLLQAHGFVVRGAVDGQEALEVLLDARPDIIVSDVHMPRVDGFELARRLKSNPDLGRIPLLAVTALAMVGDREKLISAGFDGYIAKPIQPETLVPQILAFLSPGREATSPFRHDEHVDPAQTRTGPSLGRVLVVDDARINRQLIESMLIPQGFEIETVATVSEALSAIHDHRPDIVLSDLHVGGNTALDLLRALREDAALRDLPVLVISSTVWPERDSRLAQAEGAAAFLVRPIDSRNLVECITENIRKGNGSHADDSDCR